VASESDEPGILSCQCAASRALRAVLQERDRQAMALCALHATLSVLGTVYKPVPSRQVVRFCRTQV